MAGALASKFYVSALIRLAATHGGFAAVLARGDETGGALILSVREKGRFSGLWGRILGLDGSYGWEPLGPQDVVDEAASEAYISRYRRNDPDLWVVELDIPDAAQFIAQLAAQG